MQDSAIVPLLLFIVISYATNVSFESSIWNSHGGEYEDGCVLGRGAM